MTPALEASLPLLVALLALGASAVGTFSGFGTSTIMVPVILLVFPFPQTLLFVGVIHAFGNLWKLLLFRRGVHWRLLFLFGGAGIPASVLGARLSAFAPQAVLLRVLGFLLVVYVIWVVTNRAWRLPQSSASALAGGAFSGVLAGLFGVSGAVRSAFLSAFDLPKATYLFTGAAIAIVIDSARLVTYVAGGTRLSPPLLTAVLASLLASLVGAVIAKRFVDRVPQRYFRLFVAGTLLLVALRFLFTAS